MQVLTSENNSNSGVRGFVPSNYDMTGTNIYSNYMSRKDKILSSPGTYQKKIPSPQIPLLSVDNTKHHGKSLESPPINVNMGNNMSYAIESNGTLSVQSSKMGNELFMKTPTPTHKMLNSPSFVLSSELNRRNQSGLQSASKKTYNTNFASSLNTLISPPVKSPVFDKTYIANAFSDFQPRQEPIREDFIYYNKNNSSPSSMYENQSKENDDIRSALKILIDDLNERRRKEKDEEEKKEQEKQKTQPQHNQAGFEPQFTVPVGEPVEKKKKIDFNNMTPEQTFQAKEKFKLLYQELKLKYEKWNIKEPDFETVPLQLIYESYEKIIKTICIYQNAMKWKVYLVILIAGIEWYCYYNKGWAPFKDLLTNQIKTIHKYDNYLIEFSEQFYDDSDGEEWPLWMRFLGTLASGLACFTSINGFAGKMGITAPEFIFNEADKFVSPPDGPATLHSTGISEVPEPQTGFQDPNFIINGIGGLFNMFTSSRQQSQPSQPQTAQPVPDDKEKDDEDYYNVDY